MLKQALHLAKKERQKPTQASLRRSVSASYYAVFHFLNEEAARLLFGTAQKDREFANLARRSVAHSKLKDVCLEFTKPTPRKDCLKVFWNQSEGVDVFEILDDPNLKTIASVFPTLQDSRHEADYDFSRDFHRQQALDAVEQAEDLMKSWLDFKEENRDGAKLFAMAVMLWPGLSGR